CCHVHIWQLWRRARSQAEIKAILGVLEPEEILLRGKVFFLGLFFAFHIPDSVIMKVKEKIGPCFLWRDRQRARKRRLWQRARKGGFSHGAHRSVHIEGKGKQ